MQIKFSTKEGELPYKAQYVGYETQPIHPRLGLEGVVGLSRKSYEELLEAVIDDLRGCPEKNIEPTFSGDISPDLQKVTQLALDLMVQYNVSQGKLARITKVLFE